MAIKSSMRSLLAKVAGPRRLRITIKYVFDAQLYNQPFCLLTVSRPDHDYVFLSGYGAEAQGQYLRGKIILFVPEKQHLQGVQLKFTSRMWLG
jgi:hypothetical protein